MIAGIDGRLANENKRAGVGRYCEELLRALPGVTSRFQWQVYLDSPPRPEFPNQAHFDFCVLPRAPFWTHRVLGEELRKNTPDAFFSPLSQLPWRCPCPAVVTVHDLAFLDFPTYFPWRKRFPMRLQTAHAVRGASILLADSDSTRRDILRHYAVEPSRIMLAPLACSAGFFESVPDETQARLRAQYQLPAQYVLYVGRIQPRKNLSRLIEAFGLMLKQHPDAPHHLVLAGDAGWMEQGIHRTVAASRLGDRLHFLGHVPEEHLPALISSATALALVSLWEGFGLPVLEAMACGTAVLCSNGSSLVEVAGNAAELTDPHDTEAVAAGLKRLCFNDIHRRALETRGREHARTFSWARTAQTLVQALEQAAASSHKSD